jgi:DamX protein
MVIKRRTVVPAAKPAPAKPTPAPVAKPAPAPAKPAAVPPRPAPAATMKLVVKLGAKIEWFKCKVCGREYITIDGVVADAAQAGVPKDKMGTKFALHTVLCDKCKNLGVKIPQ